MQVSRRYILHYLPQVQRAQKIYHTTPAYNMLLVSNPTLLRDAQTHFDHAKALNPDNDLAQAFLEKVCTQNMTRILNIFINHRYPFYRMVHDIIGKSLTTTVCF